MASTVSGNGVGGGLGTPHIYDYSQDKKLSTLITYMENNDYQWCMMTLNRDVSNQRAVEQVIFHIEDFKKVVSLGITEIESSSSATYYIRYNNIVTSDNNSYIPKICLF